MLTTGFKRALRGTSVLLASIAVCFGCDDKPQIRVYDAPADEPVPEAVAKEPIAPNPVPATSGSTETANVRTQIDFELPDGWKKVETTSRMRLVSIDIMAKDQQGQVSITRFPGNVGSKLSNVNRWRGQVGLPVVNDLDALDEQTIGKQTFDGLPCTIYDIGPAQDKPDARRIVVAAIEDARSKWFVKMDGPNALVDSELEAFSQFMQSLQLPLARTEQ